MTQTPPRAPSANKKFRPVGANQPTKDKPTVLEHLQELRVRLFAVAVVLLAGAMLGYAIHDRLVGILLAPLDGQKLIYLTPGGGFDFIFKVSLYVGLAFAIPVAVYQVYKYLAPLMKAQTRRFTVCIFAASCSLAVFGATFGFFVALPAALRFLTHFGGDYIQASLTAASYLNFVAAYLLGLAALFQLPLILLFLDIIIGPLKPAMLLKSEPYVLLGVFILAAIITPTPDVINQTIVAAPVLAVYQFGVVAVLLRGGKRRRTAAPLPIRMPAHANAPQPAPLPVRAAPAHASMAVARPPSVSVAAAASTARKPVTARPSRPVMDVSTPKTRVAAPLLASPRPTTEGYTKRPTYIGGRPSSATSLDGVFVALRPLSQ